MSQRLILSARGRSQTLRRTQKSIRIDSILVGAIAAASQEQSAGIEEVNKVIVQMAEPTQQNAALFEQAAATSESLGEQADEPNQMMDFFTVDGTGADANSEVAGAPPRGVQRRSAGRP